MVERLEAVDSLTEIVIKRSIGGFLLKVDGLVALQELLYLLTLNLHLLAYVFSCLRSLLLDLFLNLPSLLLLAYLLLNKQLPSL